MSASDNRALRDAVQQLAGTYNKDIVSITACIVTSISDAETKFTVDCTAISGVADTSIPGVRLNAEANDGMLIVPKLLSTIMVVNSSMNEYYAYMYSDIEKIICIIDSNNRYEFGSGGFIWNGGVLGGMTKTLELKVQLDKMNTIVQNLVTVLRTWTVVPNDGGAALQAAANFVLASLPNATFTNIEDTKILH